MVLQKFQPLFVFIILLSLQSCISHESLISYKNEGSFLFNNPQLIKNDKIILIQTNDVLDIKVHSRDILTAAPFNLIPPTNASTLLSDPNLLQLSGYLVDKGGFIDFPVLGKLHIQGLSTDEAKEKIIGKLKDYLKNPVVNIRFLNFKVTVAGEVNRPGSFTIYNDRISLPEILSMAGDLTPYANRESILIVREFNGNRTYASVSMNSNKIFESDYYFLQQNDYIYIEPIEAKRGAVLDKSDKVLPFVSAIVSVAALLISVLK